MTAILDVLTTTQGPEAVISMATIQEQFVNELARKENVALVNEMTGMVRDWEYGKCVRSGEKYKREVEGSGGERRKEERRGRRGRLRERGQEGSGKEWRRGEREGGEEEKKGKIEGKGERGEWERVEEGRIE